MQLGILGIRKAVVVGGISILALVAMSLPGEAGVKPGDFITRTTRPRCRNWFHPASTTKCSTG